MYSISYVINKLSKIIKKDEIQSLFFLIDNSGSMAGSRLNLVKHACKSIIKSSNENIEISIFTFSTRGVMIQTFYIMNNHNKEIFIKDIDNIQTDGTTNLHLGLDVSMNYIKHYPNPENIITHLLVFTDGEPDKKELHIYENLLKPFSQNKKKKVNCTVLAMDIVNKDQYVDPNIVKIIHDINDQVLYTSRAPIPYCKKFSKKIRAKRIYGLFAFKWKFLKEFTNTKESFLEKIESCDSNRICDNERGQFIARQKFTNSFSVDCPADLKKVTRYMKKDNLFKIYKDQCL